MSNHREKTARGLANCVVHPMIVNGNKFNICTHTNKQTHKFRNNLYFVTQLTKQTSHVYCGTKRNTKLTRTICTAFFSLSEEHTLWEKSQNNCNWCYIDFYWIDQKYAHKTSGFRVHFVCLFAILYTHTQYVHYSRLLKVSSRSRSNIKRQGEKKEWMKQTIQYNLYIL